MSVPSATAAPGDIGYEGPSYLGVENPPTADKPQSKLWHNDGFWWAVMFHSASQTWRIYRLDRATETWTDTGVVVDERDRSLADVLSDGSKLYVASHSAIDSSETQHQASQPGNPARLYRYSYNASTDRYSLDTGFPAQINDVSSESLTIDKDSTGRLWATWTQVTEATPGTFTAKVYVNHTTTSDAAWGTPSVLPANGAGIIDPDDISSVVAYDTDHVGVMWSNQLDGTMYWAWRKDTDAVDAWHDGVARRGTKLADDHLNLKTLMGDSQGRVFAVTKTSLDQAQPKRNSDPEIELLVFKPGTGSWSHTTFGTVADCHTRPILVLDEQNQRVHVFATGPTGSGCAFSGQSGTIYTKSAPMSDPVFPPGRGTPVIRDASSASGTATSGNVNNPTSTKQPVNNATGLVVLASNDATDTYWHADIALAAPESSFTTTTDNGTAPLTVQFTDTSTNNPTGWAWDFGDGDKSTARNPSHTFQKAGTYTVTLTASNAAGADTTPATRTITVIARPESSFTATPESGTAPLAVDFKDTSTNDPTGWAWDFGDGNSSTEQSPSHTYQKAGTYTVKLTASNAAGADTTPATTTISVGVAVGTVDISTSRSAVTWPARVTIRGLVHTPAGEAKAGQPVELWQRKWGGDWSRTGTVTSDADGAVALIRRPSTRTTYQWRVPGLDVASQERSVSVKPLLSAHRNRQSVSVNGTVLIYGRATPTRDGATVKLQRWSPTRGWVNVQTKKFTTAATATRVSRGAQYAFTVKQWWSARTTYRVVVPADSGRQRVVKSGLGVRWYKAAMTNHRAFGNEFVTVKNTGKVRLYLGKWTLTTKTGKVLRIKARPLGVGVSVRIHPGKGRTTKRDMYLGGRASFWPHGRLVLRDNARVVVAVRRW